MRKVPKKNYLIAIIFMISTLILTYILVDMYLNVKEVIDRDYMNYLSQIMPDELDSYIIETHDGMIYMAKNKNRNIDRAVKKVLVNNDYTKDTVYLNLDLVSDKFYENISSKYKINRQKIKENNIVIIKNKKIIKIINLNEQNIKRLKKNIDNFYEE